MKISIGIQMDNAAFEDNPTELSDILATIQDRMQDADEFTVQDSNGNTVGKAVVSVE